MAVLTKNECAFSWLKTKTITQESFTSVPSAEIYWLIHSCWPGVTSRYPCMYFRYNPKNIPEGCGDGLELLEAALHQ